MLRFWCEQALEPAAADATPAPMDTKTETSAEVTSTAKAEKQKLAPAPKEEKAATPVKKEAKPEPPTPKQEPAVKLEVKAESKICPATTKALRDFAGQQWTGTARGWSCARLPPSSPPTTSSSCVRPAPPASPFRSPP